MKLKLFFSVLFLLLLSFCKSQDSTVVLNTSMFDANFQSIYLSAKDGWIFKEGNDTNWARKDISTTGWKKFNPTQLTIENADKNGRVEGWFRIRFRLDSSFQNQPVGIQMGRWAATDVYIDGTHIISSGNTGLNGKPYQENRMNIPLPEVVDLVPGVDHILALHLVDYRSPLKPTLLKTGTGEHNTGGFGSLVKITGRESPIKSVKFQKEFSNYYSIWISVCAVLCIVFWFLYFLNRSAKNLLLIAIVNTFFSISMFCEAKAGVGTELSFTSWSGYIYATDLFGGINGAVGFLFLGYVFRRKLSFLLLLLIIIYTLLVITNNFYFSGKLQFPLGISVLLIDAWFVIPSWKNLKGALWAVVVGLLLTLIWNVLFWYNYVKYQQVFPFPFAYLYITGTFLSFPLSQMVYVAMRFKEILLEVRENAQQVVQLSEEKKEQALNQQKMLEEEVAKQTIELRTAFENLKSAQSQLIQSEKMASLGELTAGIAHEIQNPLNFVNNFSEVNTELIDELKEEIDKGNIDEVKVIANDIKENEEKIIHHGKRADAIVKGMLQHSRASTGKKEPTDINALADEYLRLSYHGMRAKDKSFNATLKTDFDTTIGKINVVPQDIGRVLLEFIQQCILCSERKEESRMSECL